MCQNETKWTCHIVSASAEKNISEKLFLSSWLRDKPSFTGFFFGLSPIGFQLIHVQPNHRQLVLWRHFSFVDAELTRNRNYPELGRKNRKSGTNRIQWSVWLTNLWFWAKSTLTLREQMFFLKFFFYKLHKLVLLLIKTRLKSVLM